MSWKRTLALLFMALICLAGFAGCMGSKDDGVDAPLAPRQTGPPPPRPNKPTLTLGGTGGG